MYFILKIDQYNFCHINVQTYFKVFVKTFVFLVTDQIDIVSTPGVELNMLGSPYSEYPLSTFLTTFLTSVVIVGVCRKKQWIVFLFSLLIFLIFYLLTNFTLSSPLHFSSLHKCFHCIQGTQKLFSFVSC